MPTPRPLNKVPIAGNAQAAATVAGAHAGSAAPAVQAANKATLSEAREKAGSESEITQTLGSLNEILDAFFDYNAFQLRPDAMRAVTDAAGILRRHMETDAGLRLIVEGHCDERGSAEFNLALGDRRAEAVRDLLSQLGLPASRMTTISFGETRPACGESSENCWQRNRRAHIRHESAEQ